MVTHKGLQRVVYGPSISAATALSGKMQERVELEAEKAILRRAFKHIKSARTIVRHKRFSKHLHFLCIEHDVNGAFSGFVLE